MNGRARHRLRTVVAGLPLVVACTLSLPELEAETDAADAGEDASTGGSSGEGGGAEGGSAAGGAGNAGSGGAANGGDGGDRGGAGNDAGQGGEPSIEEDSGVPPCLDGFLDCDGIEQNGCEVDFRLTDARDQVPLIIPKRDASGRITVDGQQDEDWLVQPLWSLNEPCPECTAQQPDNTVTERALVPLTGDLLAGFRMAWDGSRLFLWYQAWDDSIESVSTPGSTMRGNPDASYDDGFEIILDGSNDDVLGSDDHQLFFSVNGSVAEYGSDALELAGEIETVTRTEANCLFVEASVTFDYLSGLGGVPAIREEGEEMGFNFAINDHDGGERQSQVFFQNPGDGYWFRPEQLSVLQLGGEFTPESDE